MGQEIVYCFRCQKRILGSDFAKGHAYKLAHHVTCPECAAHLLATLPLPEREQLLAQMNRPGAERPSASSARTPAPRPSASSTRVKAVTSAHERPEEGSGRSPGLKAGLAALGVLGVLGVVVVLASGRPKPAPESAVRSEPRPEPDRSPPPAAPAEDPRLSSAREALARAREFARRYPRDPHGPVRLWEEAAAAASGTRLAGEAGRERDAARDRRREAIARELAELEGQVRPLVEAQRHQAAVDLLQAARKRHELPEWSEPVGRRLEEVRGAASKLIGALKERALAAHKSGAADEVKAARERILLLGGPEQAGGLDLALAGSAAPPPEAAPLPPPAPSPEAAAYAARWSIALEHARLREYPAAARELEEGSKGLSDGRLRAEAAADLEALRALGGWVQEARDLLAKWPKGQKLALEAFDESGAPVRLEGTVLRADAARVLLKLDEGAVPVELGEVTAASLVDVLGQRPGRKPEDRLAALLCLIEGDEPGARRARDRKDERVPERFWAHAAKLSERRLRPEVEERERRARQLFSEMEAGLQDPSTTFQAVQASASLLKEHAETDFVRRNRASIAARAEAGRDYVFFPDQLRGAGGFRLSKGGKVDACWLSETDVEPGKTAGNYVEFAFGAMPDAEYKAWVYAGGCCLETFTFQLQGTEVTASNPQNAREKLPAEPGAERAAPVKVGFFLKANHQGHGPKSPARWEWVPLPLPKYAAPGTKTVRLLSAQQGFAVAYAVVSGRRSAAPSVAELKELEKSRPEPALLPAADATLLAYYPFDEGSGETAKDASGRGSHAALRGATWAAGRHGGGVRFDGNNSWVELPNPPELDKLQDGSYTLAAWFKPEALPAGKEPDNDCGYGLVVKAGNHEGLMFHTSGFSMTHYFPDAKWSMIATQGRTYPPGAFYHVAGVVDRSAGVTQLYVNGRPEGAARWPAPNAAGLDFKGTPWRIGIGLPGGSQYRMCAKGILDEVRLYRRALGGAEIAALYRARPRFFPAGPSKAPAAEARPWKPIFDGKTLEFLPNRGGGVWRVENGAVVNGSGDLAARTDDLYGDGEYRLRFEVSDSSYFFFRVRQSAEGHHGVEFNRGHMSAWEPREHELILSSRGQTVTATLDGKPVPVDCPGRPAKGAIQFNTASGVLRIKSLEFRELP